MPQILPHLLLSNEEGFSWLNGEKTSSTKEEVPEAAPSPSARGSHVGTLLTQRPQGLCECP